MASYHPEPYWNNVAARIAARSGFNIIAGDDEPYYRYKRKRFLKLLHAISFAGKTVLEIGCGPGGNLLEIYKQHPKALQGVDISEQMIALATKTIAGTTIQVQKTDGTTLPFAENDFDVSFTSTVLQHNTDEPMLHKLVAEISRVTSSDTYIFERIENKIRGTELCIGRPGAYYQTLFGQHGFALMETTFLNIPASYFVSGVIRKLFNGRSKNEGEPISNAARFLQNSLLPVTALFDPLIKQKRELALLHFKRK